MKHLIRLTPATVGVNALVIPNAVGTNSNVIPCTNCSGVRLFGFVDFTAATNVAFSIQGCEPMQDWSAVPVAANWFNLQSELIALGIGTLSDYSNLKATGGADRRFSTLIGTEGLAWIRLADIYDMGGTSTLDTLTVSAVLIQEN